MKEIKRPEPTVDSRQTGHLSKQLVRPQQKTENNVIEARCLSEGQQERGWRCSSTSAESYQPPCSLVAPSSEGRRTLYTLQHCLHAPGPHMRNTGMGRWSSAWTARSRAITHTHMSRPLSRDPMVVEGLVVHAPIPCSSRWRHRWWEDPRGIPLPRPMCLLPNP